MPETKRTARGVLGGFLGLIGLAAVAGLLVTAAVTPAIALTSNAATSAINLFDKLPSYLDIDELMVPTTLYYKDPGSGEYVVDTQFYDQNRSPVGFDEIAPVMIDALLSSEDPRYYDHGGIDIVGTARALLSNVQGGGETQGGSSISQQYVKNVLVQKCEWDAETIYKTNADGETVLDDEGNPVVAVSLDEAKRDCWMEATTASGSDGYKRKVQEMRYAIALEQRYSKNDILLGYLNIANFGGTNYGIDAAAKYYFGVSAANLNLTQAATLAGMVQNPNSFRIDRPEGSFYRASTDSFTNTQEDGYADTTTRRNYVLDRMLVYGKITQEQYDEAKAEPVTPNITAPKSGCINSVAPYYCQYVKAVLSNDPVFGETWQDRQDNLRQGGMQVYMALDLNLQQTATATMQQYTPAELRLIGGTKGGDFGAAATSVEADTGRVLAIAQNTQFSETIEGNKAYSSLVYAGEKDTGGSIGFPSGSTFKLFTLLDWLEKDRSLNEVLNGRARNFDRFTNTCTGDWVRQARDKMVPNSGGAGGFVGTPLQFTTTSMNSGFFAMAEELDLCDVQKVATKLGVEKGDGSGPVDMNTQFSILGSNNVSLIAMAGAYATVANKGILCTPHAIDRITDAQGNDLPMPENTCEQELDPAVAATAAYALRSVMTGGTGTAGNPGGPVPVIGKTGTHNKTETWLIESSTKVTTSVWVGNADGGDGDVFINSGNGTNVAYMRFYIARDIQARANELYGGEGFPAPDRNLTRVVYADLPNVVGMTVSQATQTLSDAGFGVTVGPEVDSTEGKGIVAQQSPGAGKVAGGTTVTINPSNGNGVAIPDGLVGMSAGDARNALMSAGFGNVDLRCQEQEDGTGTVTAVSPGSGTVTNRNARVKVTYTDEDCPGGSGP
ncbi:MAG: transglycosylase domain-containing protein [Microbacterium sp.]|uniref:transglycosylase domain-containing protein n=1 Tax=Microbacterium sp. TaxID=51671 RepID=UPI003A894DE5